MVGVGGDAGDDVGVARLHRARGAAQRHHARRAAGRDVVEPARRKAQVLGDADGGVGREREAADGEAVDLVLGDSRALDQRLDRLADEPVRAVRRVAHVRARSPARRPRRPRSDRREERDVTSPLCGAASSRACRCSSARRARLRASSRSSLRWIFCETVSGKRLDEGDVARRLEVGEPLERMADDAGREPLGRRRVRRLAQDDAGEHLVAAHRVGRRRDAARGHRRMLVEDALDLDRRDVLAAPPDHVLAPVDEVEVALGAAPDDVAGVEPAVGPRRLGRRVVLQVADEEIAARVDAGGANEQLAGNVDAAIDALLVDDARLDIGRRRARSSSCRRGAARGAP